MSLYNLGSIANDVFDLTDNIPDSVSGAMIQIVDRRRISAEQHTGLVIGSVDIIERYQGPLIDLTLSRVSRAISDSGFDGESIKIGEFTIKKGNKSSIETAATFYKTEGMEALDDLKGRFNYNKANG